MGNVISVEFLADITSVIDGVNQIIENVARVGDISGVVGELSSSFSQASTLADDLASSVAGIGQSGASAGEAAAAISEIATAAQNAASAVTSDMTSVGDAIQNVGTEATGLSDEFTNAGGGISSFVSMVQDGMSQVSQKFADGVAAVQEYAAGVQEQLTAAGNSVMEYSQKSASMMQEGATGFKGAMGGVQSALGNIAMPLMTVQMATGMVQQAFQQATGPFGDFQSQMTQLETGAGELPQNLGAITSGIEQMSEQTGESTSQLAQGMFLVSSASVKGASTASAQLAILKDAAEGAAVGGTDLGTMADALTTDLNAYGQGANMAGADTNQMIATVAAGKMHMGELAASLSAVLPIAASAGISFAQVGGAIATMTAQGMPAQQATQNLANTISALQNPNAQAVTEMQAMGLSANQVSMQLGKKGLTGTLEEISQAVIAHMGPAGLVMQSALKNSATAAHDAQLEIQSMPKSLQGIAEAYLKGQVSSKEWSAAMKNLDPITQHMMSQFKTTADRTEQFNQLLTKGGPAAQTYNAAMSKILGGTTGLNTALKLTGDHMSTFQSNVNSIASAATKGGNSITGWARVQSDFNTKMAQAAAGANVMWINIGQNLAPAILTLLGASQSAGAAMSNFAGWLSQSSPGAIALKILLIALAGAGIGALLSMVPAMIVGLSGMAVAAWSAAAAFIVLNWPIMLIVAALALLVVGVILVVQHWGQIVGFLRGIWQAFASWFMGLWSTIVSWISGVVASIGAFFVSAWAKIVSGAQTAWNMLVTIVKIALIVLLAIVFAPIVAIAALFIWLYQHNTYFQKLIDTMKNFILNGVTWLRQIWTDIVNWVIARWTYFKEMATVVFMAVYVTIQQKIQQVRDFITSIWNNIVSFLSGIWHNITSQVGQAWTNISNVFSNAYNTYIEPPLLTMRTNLLNFFTNLASTAITWGKNLIQGFINGITSMVGNVGGAVGQIAGKVMGFLGFHSPAKEGPGRELDIWGPNMVKGFVAGLDNNVPLVEAAVTHLMQPVAALGTAPTSAVTGNTGTHGQASGGNVTHIHEHHIYLDGEQITDNVMTRVTSRVRSNGPVGRSAA